MERRSGRASGLVFGGIMAALALVFALVPVLTIFLPIPIVLTYVRFGGRTAALTSVITVLLSAMFLGIVQAILLVPGGILPGLVFGYGVRNKLRPMTIGLIAVVFFFVGYAAEYTISRAVMFEGRDPIQAAAESEVGRQQLSQTIGFLRSVYAPANATPAQQQSAQALLQLLDEFERNPVAMTWTLLPSGLFLLGSISTWINYQLCRLVLPRFGHEVPKATPFGEFRLPAWLTWVFVLLSMAMSFSGLQGSLLAAPWWVQLLFNVLSPLSLIFVLSGLAVAYGFLRKRDIPKPAAIGITLLGFFLGQYGQTLYMMLAMWDTIFDFRGLGHGMLKRADDTP